MGYSDENVDANMDRWSDGEGLKPLDIRVENTFRAV